MSDHIDTPQTDTAPDTSAAPEDDLRAALGAAYDEVSTASETDDAPQRDERGRFASAARDAAEAADGEPPAGETPAEAAPEAPAAPAAAPALPPDVAALNAVLDAYRPLYAAKGLPPEQAVRILFEAQKMLDADPAAGIANLARQYRVDLRQFAPQQPQQAQQPQNPNDVLAAMQREIQELRNERQAERDAVERVRQTEMNAEIARFSADPKNVHFPAVKQIMGNLMVNGHAETMEQAYEMACRAHPEVHKAIAGAETAAKAKAEADARARAAAGAKSKAVQVRGFAPMSGAPAVPDSIRGILEAVYDGRLQ